MRPFLRDEALKPEVVKLFRDRLAPAAQAAFDAGVAALTAGDYRKAEASFKSAVGPDIDSTSLLVYLGVIYAANNDDAGGRRLADGALWRRRHPAAVRLVDAGTVAQAQPAGRAGSPRGSARKVAVRCAVHRAARGGVRDIRKGKGSGPAAGAVPGQEPGRCRSGARVGVEWLYQIHAAGRVVHDRRRRPEPRARLGRPLRERPAAGARQAVARRSSNASRADSC